MSQTYSQKGKKMIKGTVVIIVLAVLLSFQNISAAKTEADNSKHNKTIEETKSLNAQDQGSSEGDIKLTQSIRKEVVDQDKFSSDAKNIKIISLGGNVTLKGPVKSIDEKKKIEAIANKIAGKNKMKSEITIAN